MVHAVQTQFLNRRKNRHATCVQTNIFLTKVIVFGDRSGFDRLLLPTRVVSRFSTIFNRCVLFFFFWDSRFLRKVCDAREREREREKFFRDQWESQACHVEWQAGMCVCDRQQRQIRASWHELTKNRTVPRISSNLEPPCIRNNDVWASNPGILRSSKETKIHSMSLINPFGPGREEEGNSGIPWASNLKNIIPESYFLFLFF